MCMCVSVWVSSHECSTHGGQEDIGPLELELQVVVNCPMWVLRIELGSSAKAVLAPNP